MFYWGKNVMLPQILPFLVRYRSRADMVLVSVLVCVGALILQDFLLFSLVAWDVDYLVLNTGGFNILLYIFSWCLSYMVKPIYYKRHIRRIND